MNTNQTGAHNPADLNHDGKMDAKFTDPFDLDGDGVAESVAGDVNLDGRIDSVYIDTDGDGYQETTILDMNRDGVGDTIWVDENGDTLPDTVVPFGPQSFATPMVDGGQITAMPFDTSSSMAPFSTSSPFDTSTDLTADMTLDGVDDETPQDWMEAYNTASDASSALWSASVNEYVNAKPDEDPSYNSYVLNAASNEASTLADEAWAEWDASYE